jgi:RNA polymerase sporulation-specific sigma factor
MQRVLNERERRILLMRYGLGGCAELTQTQVGAILGISRSYVSRIEKKALEKLAAIFQALQSEEKN